MTLDQYISFECSFSRMRFLRTFSPKLISPNSFKNSAQLPNKNPPNIFYNVFFFQVLIFLFPASKSRGGLE